MPRGKEKPIIVTSVQRPDNIFVRYEASKDKFEQLESEMETFYRSPARMEDLGLRILSPGISSIVSF